MRLFLDANVVFSAGHSAGGRAQELVALAQAGHCSLHTSRHALDEARRNLEHKSREFEERLAATLEHVTILGEAPAQLLDWARGEGLPTQDAPILAAAVHAGVELLVTGDARDFGPLFGKVLRGVRVVTLAEALARVLKAGDA